MTSAWSVTISAQADPHPHDSPAWSSLCGPHAHFAEGTTKALWYLSAVCTDPAFRGQGLATPEQVGQE